MTDFEKSLDVGDIARGDLDAQPGFKLDPRFSLIAKVVELGMDKQPRLFQQGRAGRLQSLFTNCLDINGKRSNIIAYAINVDAPDPNRTAYSRRQITVNAGLINVLTSSFRETAINSGTYHTTEHAVRVRPVSSEQEFPVIDTRGQLVSADALYRERLRYEGAPTVFHARAAQVFFDLAQQFSEFDEVKDVMFAPYIPESVD